MGLSEPVDRAVDQAVDVILALVGELLAAPCES